MGYSISLISPRPVLAVIDALSNERIRALAGVLTPLLVVIFVHAISIAIFVA
jgi:hypothetical protein